ncbi:hypothetical protein PHMEG_00020263 [Phytophthora megakarya]|uniref:Uncharacterized protein n=1 Tax=Phytophthora megakarya TaxID=4795 RepID=A0A225VQG8_9STRA|nr:hypothetical protein PHMEG_00020263 [Phytophthora megakarya]
MDITFARKVGCYIDSSQIKDSVGIGDNVYRTEGRTWVKVTLAGSLLSGRRQLYSDKAKFVNVGQYLRIQAGELVELPLRLRTSIQDKLWITRGDRWVPPISDGPGRTKYISITNIENGVLVLHQDQRIGIWLTGDHVLRLPGFISIGSCRYMVWQNLALEATTDARSEDVGSQAPLEPAVDRSEYKKGACNTPPPKTTSIEDEDVLACVSWNNSTSEIRPLELAFVAREESDRSSIAYEDSISHVVTVK